MTSSWQKQPAHQGPWQCSECMCVCDGFLSGGPVLQRCLGLFGSIINTKAPCWLNKTAPRPLNPQDKPAQPLPLYI